MNITIRRVLLGSLILLVLLFLFVPVVGQRGRLGMEVKEAFKAAWSIHQALFAFVSSHDQHFPTGEHNSNEAYRELFKADLIDDERRFFVQGCPWHGGLSSTDGIIGDHSNGFAQALGPGENHFAYTSGLTSDCDDANIPIVMDGFTDQLGTWGSDPKIHGGIWKGRYAITVRIAGNAKVNDLDANGHIVEVLNGKRQDLFDLLKSVPSAKLLNPDPPIQ